MQISYEQDLVLKLIYASQPKQTLFHDAVRLAESDRSLPFRILYGGAAGGGKTEALVWEIWRWGTHPVHKKLKIGVFRKTIPEVEKYFVSRCLDVFINPPDRPIFKYNSQKRELTFFRYDEKGKRSNGTVVEFNFCEYDSDVTKYQGAQWDILIIDELTHHTEYVYKYLQTRNRLTRGGAETGFRPLFLCTTNPGGVGHAFVKRLFIDKDDYREGEGDAGDYTFIQARIYDNEALLKNDPEYLNKLKGLGEMDRRALLEGDWNIFAGQYFPEINREIHSFPGNARPPRSWPKFIALDYGYFPHPASAGWYAVGPDGILFRYRELLVQRYTFTDLARRIVELTPSDERSSISKDGYIVLPPDIFAKKGLGAGKSGAEEMDEVFQEAGVKWAIWAADNDRVSGWRIMRQVLKPYLFGETLTAKLKVSELCINWWKSVPMMQHDPHHPEDILKIGVTNEGKITDGDDIPDETRYAIMSRYEYNPKIPKEKVDRYGNKISTKKETKYKGFNARPEYKGFQTRD